MPRLAELLPYGHWSTIRLERKVPLHAMVSSAGRAREHAASYRWDGRERGLRPFAVVQVTLGGSGVVERSDVGLRVPAGSAMIAHVPDAHVYRVDPDIGYWDFAYVVLFGSELLRLLRAVAPPERPVIAWPQIGRPESALYDLVSALAEGRRRSVFDLSALSYQLAMTLLAGEDYGEAGVIARVERYVRDHLEAPVTVEELARVAGLSRHHFSRRFAAATGLAPVRYIREARCERAARLLSTTELSVKEVGVRCGFSDTNYFCRVFRNVSGMSPGAFRRSRP